MLNCLIIITLLLSLETYCDDTSDAPTTGASQEEVDDNADHITSAEAEPELLESTTTNQQPITANHQPSTIHQQPTSIAGKGARKKKKVKAKIVRGVSADPLARKSARKKKKVEGKIVGGVPADPSEFPSNVQFFNLGSMCGGSILTVRTIFTAAHCFTSNTDLGCMRVVAGARFVHDPLAQSFLVWEFTIHEDYNKESVFSNDIAVVMISGEFQFGPNVQRAVLMDHNKLRNKKNFRVAGYGKTKYNQQPFENTKFMKTTLQYVKKKRCLRLIQEKLGPHVFCLGGSKKGRDTCQGDSGAGVLWQNLTVGMVSFGIGCGVKPGVYVRVFNFRSWLLTAAARLASAYCQHARG